MVYKRTEVYVISKDVNKLVIFYWHSHKFLVRLRVAEVGVIYG